MTTVALQFDEVIGLLANAGFLWTLLLATWGAVSYSFMRHRRHGPKVGPSQTAGAVSFSLTKPRLSEEEIFRILTTTETNIQIVRICESPKTARELSKGLGDIYPGHKEKGFPAEKLGEHLANLGGQRYRYEDGPEVLRLRLLVANSLFCRRRQAGCFPVIAES